MHDHPMEADVSLRDEVIRLRARVEELRTHLEEPAEIVRAIRQGEVDAFVISDPRGEKIYNLRRADILYRHMVEEMREGAAALDPSGLIVYANSYLAGLLKIDREALIGIPVFPLVPEANRPFFDTLGFDSAVEAGRGEILLRASDGSLFPVQATLTPIELEDGRLFCWTVADLTSERRGEQLLRESRQKDIFLATLAHELRNPIAPIRNAAQLIKIGDESEPRLRWAKGVIERQVTQLSKLVDDLLDISRVTRGKIRLDLQPVHLETAITRGIETAQPAIDGRGHRLTVQMPEGPVLVMGDATRLSQVVSNILHNAAKFTPEGGQIWLTLERDGAEARIRVRDSGIGIHRDMLANIFDLFTQVDSTLERAQGGLGIGLALVRTLVELHEGRVTVDSQGPGRGSEFTVALPLLSAGADRSKPSEPPSPAVGAHPERRRVLVVDDNVDAAETLMFFLEDLGHEVQMVTEGRRVLEAARKFRPQLVLLDIGLPDVNGFDIAVELRSCAETRDLCLVALTGYAQETDRRRSSEVGFDHHWIKPIDLDALESLLNSLQPGEPLRQG